MGKYLSVRRERLLKFTTAAIVAIIALLALAAAWIQKLLWMGNLGYASIFWTLWSVRWEMSAVAFLAAFLYLWLNLRAAAKKSSAFLPRESTEILELIEQGVGRPSASVLKPLVLVVAAGVAVVFALFFYSGWDTWLRFRYGGNVGLADPIYRVDTGFYLFRLPFYEMVKNGAIGLALVAFLAVLATYAVFQLVSIGRGARFGGHVDAVSHLSILLAVLIGACGWGFYLDRYDLLYSTLGVVYGAGYTADHVTRIALWIMVAASAALCALLLYNCVRPRLRLILIAAGAYAALYVAGVQLTPAMFQKFEVQPNELARETPFLKNNIEFTRKAYKLDSIRETSYPALADLTSNAIARNQETIQNVRLWDSRPLLQTYRQTQEIRLYYQFYNVDVDRYHLSDGYHQVMLSVRELAAELPQKSAHLGQPVSSVHARLWVGDELRIQDHGRGISAVPAREYPAPVHLRPQRHSAGHLLRRTNARVSHRRHQRQGVRLSQGQ